MVYMPCKVCVGAIGQGIQDSIEGKISPVSEYLKSAAKGGAISVIKGVPAEQVIMGTNVDKEIFKAQTSIQYKSLNLLLDFAYD
jgi:hypothetical protein